MSEVHTRIETPTAALYTWGREEGAGILSELSETEAVLDDTETRPNVGAHVTVYITQGAESHQLDGKVSRHTDSGFAILHEEFKTTIDTVPKEMDTVADEVDTVSDETDTVSDEPAMEAISVASPKPEPTMIVPLVSAEAVLLTEYSISELEQLSERIAAEMEQKRELHQRGELKRRLRDDINRLVSQEGFSLEEIMASDDDAAESS